MSLSCVTHVEILPGIASCESQRVVVVLWVRLLGVLSICVQDVAVEHHKQTARVTRLSMKFEWCMHTLRQEVPYIALWT